MTPLSHVQRRHLVWILVMVAVLSGLIGSRQAVTAAPDAFSMPLQSGRVASQGPAARLTTLALRVHHLTRMEAFYGEAFGFTFRDERTGQMTSRFGRVGDLTIKLVPIRTTADFVEFPVHQPGFEVPDVERVIAIAKKHGGAALHGPTRDGARLTASVRDPDGNTLELYQRP
jgi:predicted enzyme related to lactoylglutathione lyase